MNLNVDRIKEYHFEDFDGYVPLVLLEYLDVKSFFRNMSPEVYEVYINARINYSYSYPDTIEFLEKDLYEWLNTYNEYEDILL